MFLSHQTYEGILVTANSVIECVEFVLQDGMKFVLTERFNQDFAEENFGQHQGVGRRRDNPSLFQFGYDSNGLRTTRAALLKVLTTRKEKMVGWMLTMKNYPKEREQNSDNCHHAPYT